MQDKLPAICIIRAICTEHPPERLTDPVDSNHPLTLLCKSELQLSNLFIVNKLLKKLLPSAVFLFANPSISPWNDLSGRTWHWNQLQQRKESRGWGAGKRDISLPGILGVWETWGSRTLYLRVLVPAVRAQLQSQLAKGSAELAGQLDGTGWWCTAKLRDVGPAGVDVGHGWFVGHLSQTVLKGQANQGRCGQALLPTACSGCNDFLAAKLNCPGTLSAIMKEK